MNTTSAGKKVERPTRGREIYKQKERRDEGAEGPVVRQKEYTKIKHHG